MNLAEQNLTEKQPSAPKGAVPVRGTGLTSSVSIALGPAEVFDFFQEESLMEKVLGDLPVDIENFLSLSLIAAKDVGEDNYTVMWGSAKDSEVPGTLTFHIYRGPANRGSIVTTSADFKALPFGDGPSDLVKLLLKRAKALAETGEIPTTKGQPSGREEITASQDKTLH
jgi:hypothetical protein